jgi:predicted ATPase/transcriptional regulator with XRE-family HTH domain
MTTAADGAGPFAALLQRYRQRAGFSQEELAERAGLSARGISDLERGVRRSPYPATVRRLAKALALDPAQRLGLLASAHAARTLDTPTTVAPALEAQESNREHQLPRVAGSEGVASSASRHNLPSQLTSFVGRGREMRQVQQLVRNARLVTLTGPGGVGKTRRALAVAAMLVGADFEDGVFLVDLAPLRDPNLVMSSVSQILRVQESGRPLLDLLTGYLRDRRTLLLIDNFEQVVAGAAGIATLLERCPRLAVLATSRAPLRLQGEHTYAVSPLALPDLQHPASPDALADVPSVDLFVQRARAVRPEFSITDSSARTVGEICARLDGLPLAVELAAARVRVLSAQGILARLDHRLALLTTGRQDQPQRHHTLRAAIDWSCELLSPAEQMLFRRLAIFSGGCTLAAVEAVCFADGSLELDVLDGLTTLLESSLLKLSGQDAEGEPRFGMLETTREYALEQLADSGELAGVAARHAQHFLSFAKDGMELAGAFVQRLDRLDAEHDNLRASLQWELDHGEAEDALELALACAEFWIIRGHLSEGQRRLEAALARAAKVGLRSPLQARAFSRAGVIAWHRGEYQRATLLQERALAVARELGEPVDIARAVNSLGILARDQGKYEQAASLFAEGLERFQAVGVTDGIAAVFANLGILARAQGDYGEAVSLGERSLELHRALGYTRDVARCCVHIGRAAACLGDMEKARRLLSDGMPLALQVGDRWTQAQCLEGLAAVALAAGKPAQAMTLLGAGASLREQIGRPPSAAESAELDCLIADARQALGEVEYAAALGRGRSIRRRGPQSRYLS